jgi:hypothetical protein
MLYWSYEGLVLEGGERPDHRERALLAGDGALGLPEGGGPLPLQLLRLLGLLLPLGQDLNTKGTLRLHLINPLYCRRDKFVPVYSSVVGFRNGFYRVFWAPNGTRLSARCHFTGPKKPPRIPGPNPLLLTLILDIPHPKHYARGCINHGCINSYHADPDPAFYLNATPNPDQRSKTNADSCGSWSWSEFKVRKSYFKGRW